MEIIVRGRSGSGKSAIAQHIAGILEARGFEVSHDPECTRNPDDQEHVLTHVAAAGLKITIIEETPARSGE